MEEGVIHMKIVQVPALKCAKNVGKARYSVIRSEWRPNVWFVRDRAVDHLDGTQGLPTRGAALRLAARYNSTPEAKAWVLAERKRETARIAAIRQVCKDAAKRCAVLADDLRTIILRTNADLLKVLAAKGNPRIVAFKYCNVDGSATSRPNSEPKLKYEVGSIMCVPNADTNKRSDCARGVNIASAGRIHSTAHRFERYRFFRVELRKSDIAAIPQGGNGKFRAFQALITEELSYSQIKEIQYGRIN
jgi:hypothetical protein